MPNFTGQGQQFGQSMGGAIDPRQILAALLKSSQIVGGGMAPVVGAMPGGAGVLPEAMIEGAQKFLKKFGEQKASEAVQQPGGLESLNQVISNSLSKQQLMNSPTGMEAKSRNFDETQAMSQPGVPQEQPATPTTPQATPAAAPQGMPGFDIGKLLASVGAGLNTYGGGESATLLNLMNSREQQAALAPERAVDLQLKQQELEGKKPMQIGDYQKELLKQASDMQKEGRLKPSELLTKYEEATKPWTEISSAYDSMTTVLTNPKTGKLDFSGFNPAADLDLLYRTAKTLDPSGRVTDSDIAIQQATTGAFGDRFRRIGQKLKRGGILTEDERKFMFQAATQRFKSAEKQQGIVENGFKKLAKENEIQAERFMRPSGLAQNQQSNKMKVGRFQVEVS